MKKTSKVLAISALVLGTIGAATASGFIIKDAVSKSLDQTADAAMILEWGATQNIGDITSLTPGAPSYRSVSVKAPSKSTGLTAEAEVTFTLAVGDSKTLNGVKVSIAEANWSVSGTVPLANGVLNVDGTPVPTFKSTITADKTFYLKFTITQAAFDEYAGGTGTLGGTFTASYGKKA